VSWFDRWLRSARRKVSPGVAASSQPKCDTEVVENKPQNPFVANVAAFPIRKNSKEEGEPFQNLYVEKAATTATNGNIACKANGLGVANAWRRAGDAWRHVAPLPELQSAAALPVHVDFETRNIGGCDLPQAGAWRYAADPATEIITLVYRDPKGKSRLWTPTSPFRVPLEWFVNDPAYSFVCFGDFEPIVWEAIMVARHGFPAIPLARWIDARATCSYLALPRSLDKVLPVIGSEIVKDKVGRTLVLSLSRPSLKTGDYPEITSEIRQRSRQYNQIDVDGLVDVHAAVGSLDGREREVWRLDHTINRRGVRIDVEFVQAAKRIAESSIDALLAEFAGLTDGLSPYQVEKSRQWLIGQSCTLDNLRDETITEALNERTLSDDVRRVLEIRQTVAATSLKKLDAMLACVGAADRVRGMFQYHAATPGRWSGQLVQLQNLPRPMVDVDPEEIEELVTAIKTGEAETLTRWGKPLDVLASALRHALVAEKGKRFGVGDFATIETAILLALAGQRDKCDFLAAGTDVYRDMAATIYRLDHAAYLAIPKNALSVEQEEQRRIGKNTVLGCGYAMGADTFRKRYCRHMPTEEAKLFTEKVIYTYRKVWAPLVPTLWYGLKKAARAAMLQPGLPVTANCGIAYRFDRDAKPLPLLVCRLLNGKLIHYQNARVSPDKLDRWGYPVWTYWAYRDGRWKEIEPYGGQLAENVVQALARELLVDALFRFEAHGYPVVMHCHDEIVIEHPEITTETMKEIMEGRPQWAVELDVPVKVEAWTGKRYRK
jgi:DNA polymerase